MNKYNSLSDLNGVYDSETIYIIGNGPDLLNIPESFKKKIISGVSIGVNLSHLFLETNFHVAGHWTHTLFNINFGKVKDCRIFQGPNAINGGPGFGDSYYKDNNIIDTECITKVTSLSNIDSLKKPVDDNDILIGGEQIGFAATNLALIMGAKTIVYLGFDYKSLDHYYYHEPYRTKIQDQLSQLFELYGSNDFLKSDLNDFREIHFNNNTSLGRTLTDPNVYNTDRQFYSLIFQKLRNSGVEPVVYNDHSIIHDAGATFKLYE